MMLRELYLLTLGFQICASELCATKYGPINGEIFKSKDGFQANVFKGIPFAQPPINDLRFKKPKPPIPWSQPKETKKFAPACMQFQPIMKLIDEEYTSEDCLYLNLFTPHRKTEHTFPIMFFIHGGGFYLGSSIEYGDQGIVDNLVSKGVVVITVQYRLGPWGYFADGKNVYNWGLWDLISALEWVQDNAKYFGADPTKVTVAGESAGSIATALLSISKRANGLFHRGIQMSGSLYILIGKEQLLNDYSSQLTQALDCQTHSPDCLRSKNTEQIVQALGTLTVPTPVSFFPAPGDELLPKNYESLLAESPSMPMLMGTTSDEEALGRAFRSIMPEGFMDMKLKELEKNYKNGEILTKFLIQQYVHSKGDEKDKKFRFDQIMKASGDSEVYAPTHKEAMLRMRRGADVWLYSFDHFNPDSWPTSIPGQEDIDDKGAYHGTDLVYLFHLKQPFLMVPSFNFTEEDEKVSDTIATLFTNFAKFGNPESIAVKWPPISEQNPHKFLSIKAESEITTGYHREATSFWNDLVPQIESMNKFKKYREAIHEEL